MKFNKLHLNEAILKAVDDLGFEYPTPVQEKVIPELLDKEVDPHWIGGNRHRENGRFRPSHDTKN